MRHESRMLDFTRFRRNHLTPTRQLNAPSMLGVVLRTMLISWPIYLSALTVLMAFYFCLTYGVYTYVPYVQSSGTHLSSWILAPIGITDYVDKAQVTFGLLLMIALLVTFLILAWLAIFFSVDATEKGALHYQRRRFGQDLLGKFVVGLIISLLLTFMPIVAELLSGKEGQVGFRRYIVALIFGGNAVGTFSLMSLGEGAIIKRFLTTKLTLLLVAFVVLLGNVILAYEIAEFLIAHGAHFISETFNFLNFDTLEKNEDFAPALLCFGLVVILAFLVFGRITNLNYVSLNRMYRDRLMEAFMPDITAFKKKRNADPACEVDQLHLKDCCHRPLHLVNTNVVLVNSPQSRYQGRGGDNFILAPHYCGSWATGYHETKSYSISSKSEDGGVTLATAMAISGAAINPRTGPGGWGSILSSPIVASLASFLNLRLGCWVANPAAKDQSVPAHFFNAGLQGLLNIGFKESGTNLVELTDGGHFENTGIFELLRRRTDLIILSDASTDQEFNFKDIGIAIERARVDQSIDIRFLYDDYDLTHLMPGSAGSEHYDKRYNLAKRGYAVAKIKYPEFSVNGKKEGEPDFKEKTGFLIYLKATVTRKMPGDIYSYKGAFEQFPHQPISDQMYDESQFESYRELGYRIAKAMSDDLYNDIETFLDKSERSGSSDFFGSRSRKLKRSIALRRSRKS